MEEEELKVAELEMVGEPEGVAVTERLDVSETEGELEYVVVAERDGDRVSV